MRGTKRCRQREGKREDRSRVKSDGRRALGIISEANASDIPWN